MTKAEGSSDSAQCPSSRTSATVEERAPVAVEAEKKATGPRLTVDELADFATLIRGSKDPHEPTSRLIHLSAAELAQLLSLAALFSYGAAWVFTASFFSKFRLHPEDVGIDFNFLLVRASIIGGGLLGLLALLFVSTRAVNWLSRGRKGDLSGFHLLFLVAQLVYFVAVGSMAFFALRHLTGLSRLIDAILSIALAALLTAIEGSLILRSFGYDASTGVGARLAERSDYRLLSGAVLCWLFLLIPIAAEGGSWAGNDVLHGHALTSRFLQIPWVEVSRTPSGEHLGPVQVLCGLRLGIGSNETLLYQPQHHRVIAVPTQDVVVVTPLGSTCTEK